MKYPKFSIIIPAYNEEDVIKRAIESVQNQIFQDFEIIVSNDGSADKTREIVMEIMEKDKRIRLLNGKKGHSAAFARNRGAEIAKGRILVFLDADTLINDLFLDEINKKSKKADAFITLNYSLKENFMSLILSGFIGKSIKDKLRDGSVYTKENYEQGGKMFFCLTKKAYKKIGGYYEKTFYYEDEIFADDFYDNGFKSILVKKANQYYELPSTFKEFVRQCKWIGKGINTIPQKEKKKKRKIIWFLKSLFLISPAFFIFNLNYFLIILLITIILSYLGLIKRNRKPLLSLMTLPFLYVKTFLVTFNILRFSGMKNK